MDEKNSKIDDKTKVGIESEDIGSIVKAIMSEKGLSIQDVVDSSQDLTIDKVRNVIYGRPYSSKVIKQLAEALGMNQKRLLAAKKSFLVCIHTLRQANEIICDVLDEYGVIEIPSATVQQYTEDIYKHLYRNQDQKEARTYFIGMLEGHLKYGIVNK